MMRVEKRVTSKMKRNLLKLIREEINT